MKVKNLLCKPIFMMTVLLAGKISGAATLLDDMPNIGTGENADEDPIIEEKITLPAMPQTDDLIPFTPGPATQNRFFIDRKSLSIGTDKVIRYTLVIEGSGGARSINYEGIRCNGGEVRSYAFARADGTWSLARRNEWRRIVAREQSAHHVALAEEYFCHDGIMAPSLAEIEKRMQWSGATLRPKKLGIADSD